ncbi:lipocalin family protein [Caulobacter segnis]|uniref:lipocalin family protein n=1 Tax=Caulobacter segnis TaxID=88688 RepID=UPI00240F2AD6|nr:lipocalin family protein [Caulobacter segnis]MDG2521392.1 lipocalin family protein [Caulobacter segnis]
MRLLSIAAAASLILVSAARAAAPPPAKPVAERFYSGKWFEIARLPNAGQKDCEAPTTVFTQAGAGAFTVVQTCRRGSAGGKAKVFNTKGKVVEGSRNAKFSMSFLGGLHRQEYWVLDRADDQSWALMATPGGNYIWLLARQAVMSAPARAAALGRMKALGYPVERLEFPQQPPS